MIDQEGCAKLHLVTEELWTEIGASAKAVEWEAHTQQKAQGHSQQREQGCMPILLMALLSFSAVGFVDKQPCGLTC